MHLSNEAGEHRFWTPRRVAGSVAIAGLSVAGLTMLAAGEVSGATQTDVPAAMAAVSPDHILDGRQDLLFTTHGSGEVVAPDESAGLTLVVQGLAGVAVTASVAGLIRRAAS